MSNSIIYLARHATPDWSRTDIPYDIPPGPPLTAQGEAEAQKLGHFLADVGVSELYASPLERTQRTAAIAGQILDASVRTEEAIAEWRHGESPEAVLDRIQLFWQELAAANGVNGPVALVSHGGPIRLLLEAVSGDPARIKEHCGRYDHGNPLPPAGVWRTQRNGNGVWQADLVFVPKA